MYTFYFLTILFIIFYEINFLINFKTMSKWMWVMKSLSIHDGYRRKMGLPKMKRQFFILKSYFNIMLLMLLMLFIIVYGLIQLDTRLKWVLLLQPIWGVILTDLNKKQYFKILKFETIYNMIFYSCLFYFGFLNEFVTNCLN